VPRAGVAQVDQRRKGVVGCGTELRSSGCGGEIRDGKVVERVLEFEDDALSGLFADAWDLGEGGMVAATDRGDEAVGGDSAQYSDGELGADAGDGEQALEEALLLCGGKAEESDLVFADVSVDEERCFGVLCRKL